MNAYSNGGHRHHHHHGGHLHWAVPALIGAGTVYLLTRPVPVEPVIVPPPVYNYQCPPGMFLSGYELRPYQDNWGRYYNVQVPICR